MDRTLRRARAAATRRDWAGGLDWTFTSARARSPRRQTRQRAGGLFDWPSVAVWSDRRIARVTGTKGLTVAGVDERHARLHGAGTDGANESFRRCAKRPLFRWRHVLRA